MMRSLVSSCRHRGRCPSRLAPGLGAGLLVWLILAAAARGEPPAPLTEAQYLRGVNLASAEFGVPGRHGPGEHGHDYVYPIAAYAPGYDEPEFLVAQGINLFRVPVSWERLQPALFAPLDDAELGRLRHTVETLRASGAYVVVDVHNYARYGEVLIGTDTVPTAAFGDFWARLAVALQPYPEVILGLMNEPYGLPPGEWVAIANAGIAAIRDTGARHLIAVPGTRWSGAHSWFREDLVLMAEAALVSLTGGTPPPLSNAEALLHVVDPLDNYVIEVHQYLDYNSSGTHETCISVAMAGDVMEDFTEWLEDNDLRGFLGEFGVPDNPRCLAALEALLADLAANRERYIGVAYWAAGPWWGDGYPFRLERGNADDPRLQQVLGH